MPATPARVLDATVARHDEAFQLTVLASAAGELQVPRLAAAVGSPVRAYIRARDVMIWLRPPEEISALNVLPGRIAAIVPNPNGAQADVRLDCNGAVLMARLTAKSVHRLALPPAGRYSPSSRASHSSAARRTVYSDARGRSIVAKPKVREGMPSVAISKVEFFGVPASASTIPPSIRCRVRFARSSRRRGRTTTTIARRRARSAPARAMLIQTTNSQTTG